MIWTFNKVPICATIFPFYTYKHVRLHYMKNIMIVILLHVLFVNIGFTCTCVELNEHVIDELKAESDFIFIGTVQQVDNWNPYTVQKRNKERKANDVMIRVDSVIQGNLEIGELVFIYQSAGSCTETFYYGTQQLIFGDQIKRIRQLQDLPSTSNGEIPPQPPPPDGLQNDGTYETDADDTIVQFLDNKIANHVVVDTSMCRSFLLRSQSGSKVIEFLAN